MNIEEVIATEAQASENDRDAPIRPGTRITRGHSRTQTLQVRLNDDEVAALADAARASGVPTSTLARDLIKAGLAGRSRSNRELIDRVREDLDALALSLV